MNSAHDGYPLIDIDDAITSLADLIDGGDENQGRDTRISEVIRLLKHLRTPEAQPAVCGLGNK